MNNGFEWAVLIMLCLLWFAGAAFAVLVGYGLGLMIYLIILIALSYKAWSTQEAKNA